MTIRWSTCVCGLCSLFLVSCGHVALPIIYAQTLPLTLHVEWTPNVVSDAVLDYQIRVDTDAPVDVPLTACTTTLCRTTFTVTTSGVHTVAVTARNLRLSTDPTSIQASDPSTVSVTVSLAPGRVTGTRITS